MRIFKFTAFAILVLSTVVIQAQETVSTTGGDATGVGGSVSYTFGQIVYNTYTESNGSVAQGVQHPIRNCIGDANRDGQVNILDLVSVSSNFACVSSCANGDANFDGVVDILDLIAVSSNFEVICP